MLFNLFLRTLGEYSANMRLQVQIITKSNTGPESGKHLLMNGSLQIPNDEGLTRNITTWLRTYE
jgi:hypothetical protein